MTRRLVTGNTPRQELVAHAAAKLRAGRASNAHTALEAVVDGASYHTRAVAEADMYRQRIRAIDAELRRRQ